jgi:hypothetical protein
MWEQNSLIFGLASEWLKYWFSERPQIPSSKENRQQREEAGE